MGRPLPIHQPGQSGRCRICHPKGFLMKIAYVSLEGRGETDLFIAKVAEALERGGLRLAGTVQTNIHRPDRRKCDMDLRILPDGPVVRISEDRGNLARGCILDSGALEQTVVEVTRSLDGAECLIVNKFGKREGEGRGLVPVIAEALDRGIPVLVGVNGMNLPDFNIFTDGNAKALQADLRSVTDWCQQNAAAMAEA